MDTTTETNLDDRKLAEAALRNLHLDGVSQADPDKRFSSRMLELGPDGLVIDAPTGAGLGVILIPGEVISCTCRLGQEIFRFQAVVRKRMQFTLNHQMTVNAVLLSYPRNLRLVQRRRYYRVSLSGRTPVDSTLWPVHAEATGKTQVLGEHHGRIANISAGGIGVLLNGEQFEAVTSCTQLWARFMLPGENESLIFRVDPRHHSYIESNAMYLLGLEIIEFIEPGAHSAILDRIARFVADRQREHLSRLRDR